jgi:hypothetical protein
MQYTAKAVPTRSNVTCADDIISGPAEFKRVLALAARFRANQVSAGERRWPSTTQDYRCGATSGVACTICAVYDLIVVSALHIASLPLAVLYALSFVLGQGAISSTSKYLVLISFFSLDEDP